VLAVALVVSTIIFTVFKTKTERTKRETERIRQSVN
jgi:hypothetical protein